MRKINFYGRRCGRPLTPDRQSVFEKIMPQVKITEVIDTESLILSKIFPRSNLDIWMEIGFGGGEHLAHQARLHPHINFIGCEVFLNGVASLLHLINEQSITNIKIYNNDVHMLFPHLPDHSLDRLYILFPDPWPKKKHHKRRILREENLLIFHRILKPQGKLILATDDLSYAEWMFDHLTVTTLFNFPSQNLHQCLTPPDNWVETRYQAKAKAQGRTTFYFIVTSV